MEQVKAWVQAPLLPSTVILDELWNLYLIFPLCMVKLNNSYSIDILRRFNWFRLVLFLFDSVYDIQSCPI